MSTRPPLGCSVPNMVQRYIGTEYDKVKSVADNLETVIEVADNLDHIKGADNSRVSINTVANNIADVVTVSDNIDYVKDVAEAIEGLPVISYIGDEPPLQPLHGAEWYCTTDGRTYVWYVDADSGQWVESSPQSNVPASTDKMILNAAATDVTTAIALVNQIRAGLIANGLAE